MKLMRLAMCVAVFALVGGSALSEDMDVRALQAKLAAQEARLNDLQAKMYSAGGESTAAADGLTSLRKNAVVTIGGTVNTRYFSRNGKLDSEVIAVANPNAGQPGQPNFLPGRNPNGRVNVAKTNTSGMRMSDAKLEFKIDVNDYFDAYLKLDLQDDNADRAHAAQNYWVRWKNLCNSGFGILVGRDNLKYGSGLGAALVDDWNLNDSAGGDLSWGVRDGDGNLQIGQFAGLTAADEMSFNGGFIPRHTHYDYSRTVQINPYWENQDGSFKAEVSIFSALDTMEADNGYRAYQTTDGKFRSKSINLGFESYTGRLTWKPVEGLTMTGSVMSLYAKHGDGYWTSNRGYNWQDGAGFETAARNTAVNFGVEYIPCFFDKLRVWAQYSHGWNDFWVKDHDSDEINAGIEFAFTDQFSVYAQGDYLRTKNGQADVFHKSQGWAGNIGIKYVLPYGVNFEAGWRHEYVTYKNRATAGVAARKHTKMKSDTIYAHLGFNF